MPSSYVQLLLVNMLLGTLISTTVFGFPILPAVAGALGAGALLYAGSRTTRGYVTSLLAGSVDATATSDRAPSGGRRGTESATTAPTPSRTLRGAGT